MSQENVEIVRRTHAAFSEGNLGPVLAALDPDLEWNASDVFFDQRVLTVDGPRWACADVPGRKGCEVHRVQSRS
jgi:hypothetical protein